MYSLRLPRLIAANEWGVIVSPNSCLQTRVSNLPLDHTTKVLEEFRERVAPRSLFYCSLRLFIFLLLAYLCPRSIAAKTFFEERDRVIIARNGQNVARDTPAHAPRYTFKLDDALFPRGSLFAPNDHCSVLRRRCNRSCCSSETRSPRYVTYPIRMTLKSAFFAPFVHI